ncbi:MAG: L-2-amino-thiazoline-4-carboxylic acid hydrolase [Lachnospiraceae bacterium]|nr:L-2-amino-thiazoline-4-carboxylic acid hydrolase [Lachnospiraceae bacterium]
MKKLRYIRKQLIKLYGKEKTDIILKLAQKHYEECLVLCKDASKGEFMHLENTILPTTAFYKALLEGDNENALKNTNAIIISLCEKGRNVLNVVLKFPGMQSAFMRLMPKMATKMFGKECGFDYRNFEANKSILQMDMTMCPYVKYAKRFQVDELTAVFCESDFAAYGNLSNISFRRTETLGTGGSKCDFKFVRTNK